MADENVILMRDTPAAGQPTLSGKSYRLDIKDGYVYDEHGNQTERVTFIDDARTPLLANYAREQAALNRAYVMSKVDPERAALMLRQLDIDPDRLRSVNLDLGPADVHIPSAMTNFATGYSNEPPIADMMAPPLLAEKQVNSFFQFAKEDAFQRATPSQTSASEPGEISPRLSSASYSCKERALAGWVSTETEANADVPLQVLTATVRRVMDALELEREIRVQTLLQTSANLDSSVVTTLALGFEWNGGASSDPIKDIHTQLVNSWGKITALGMSLPTWYAFQRNPVVKSYLGFKSNIEPMPSADRMQAVLQLPPIHVGAMQYIDDTSAKKYVWGNHVAFIRQPRELPPRNQQDVATAYTFRWSLPKVPMDGSLSGGFIVRQFFTQHRGSLGGQKIVVVHHDDERVTSKFAGGLVLNAFR